jgi:hypothetical protein
MQSVVAFFDDSGGPDPGSGPVFALGMVVIPTPDVRVISDGWNAVIAKHVNVSAQYLALNSIEAKSSDLYDLHNRLVTGKPLHTNCQRRLYAHGLNTPQRAQALIDDCWDYLAHPPTGIRYLASVALKQVVWKQYKSVLYGSLPLPPNKPSAAARKELSRFIGEITFGWLLQRLEYLGQETTFPFLDAFLVGDESEVRALMYDSQAEAQAGFGQFTQLSRIVNNVWFGSSLHNAPLQIADWIAFVARLWLSQNPEGSRRLGQIKANFRGYPNRIKGRGIVVNPHRANAPQIP